MMTKDEIFESRITDGTGDLTNAGKDDGECGADGQRTVETQTSEEITGIPPGIDSEVPRRNRKPPVKKKPAVLSVGKLDTSLKFCRVLISFYSFLFLLN